MTKIISKAPGRTCLFGDHQDYLGLPIIACAINRHITLTATKNSTRFFNIKKPNINRQRQIDIDEEITNIDKSDHILSSLKVLRRYGCIPDCGYDITIVGDLPINAGTSSSSAVVVSWVQFLLQAFGPKKLMTPESISQIAFEAEVLEHGAPGGKMDQFSIGLGNIIYLETGEDFSYEVLEAPLKGLIIGESGVPKETVGLLKELRHNAWLAIHKTQECFKDFNIRSAKAENLKFYLNNLPDKLHPYFIAAIGNYNVTKRALEEFKKPNLDVVKIGKLMTEHHNILKNELKITVPLIDNMIESALAAGALGAKIVGSGRGGSIAVIAPHGEEEKVVRAIKNAGAKDAYQVEVDPGVRIVQLAEA